MDNLNSYLKLTDSNFCWYEELVKRVNNLTILQFYFNSNN